MVSSIFSLNKREAFKSLFVVLIGAMLMVVKTIVDSIINGGGVLPVSWPEWQSILVFGLKAGFTYVAATYFSGTGKDAALAEKNKAANK